MDEIDRLKRLLAARSDSDGKPLPGYKANVAELKNRIANLEAKGSWFHMI